MAALKIFSVTILVELIFHKVGRQEAPDLMEMDFAIDFFLEVFPNFCNSLFHSISIPMFGVWW